LRRLTQQNGNASLRLGDRRFQRAKSRLHGGQLPL